MGSGRDSGGGDHAFDSKPPGGARPLSVTGIGEFYHELRREYLAEAPARLGELRKDLSALRAGEDDAAASLKTRFHRLAGSGGSYGFSPISVAALEAERWLVANPAPGVDQSAWLEGAIGRVAEAFDAAALDMGLPAVPQRATAYGWRACLVGKASDLAARLAAALHDAQYTVTTAAPDLDPAAIRASERPDLVVLYPPDEMDAAAILDRWSSAALGRRVRLALIKNPATIDVYATPWSRVDLVVDPADAADALVRWARVEGRIASGPTSALILAAQDEARTKMVGWLESAGIRATAASSLPEGARALEHEQPDLIVVDWRIPDGDAQGFIQRIRRAPRSAMIPILTICNEPYGEDRLRALEAGAEDLLAWPADRTVFLSSAVPRAARARQLTEVVRRDPLTGFLTPGALLDEMESVLAFARRTGERLSLVLIDIDHLRRINEQLGQGTGDQVLVHLARLLHERARASDVLARMGGEEFGLLLRRCGIADAVSVAEEIGSMLEARPPVLAGAPIPVRVSAGVATFPDHAIRVRDLLHAAEQALRAAKETGRNRVEAAR